MQLIADISPTTKIVMHPYREQDGRSFLAIHADTRWGPMDFLGEITGDSVQTLKSMIREGKVRFGPRVKAWIDAIREKEGHPPTPIEMPIETENGGAAIEQGGQGSSVGQCFGGACTFPIVIPTWQRPWFWNTIWTGWWPRRPPPFWWRRRFVWGRGWW